MKEKVIAAYRFIRVWRFIAWIILLFGSVSAMLTVIYEMAKSSYTVVEARQAYCRNVDARESQHIDTTLQNIEQAKQAVERFMESYRFSLEQIKGANPSADVPTTCPFEASCSLNQEHEAIHILMHALRVSAPAVTLRDNLPCREVTEYPEELIEKNKSQLYTAIFANMKAVKEPLEAECVRVKEEIERKRARQADLKEQIEAIRHPLVKREVENQVPRDSVYLPEKSVYRDTENYKQLHDYGIALPLAASYPEESRILERSRVQAWRESVSRFAAWLPLVIHREPLRERVMQNSKDMGHTLSKEEADRITTLDKQVLQIEKEIAELEEQVIPYVNQLRSMAQAEEDLIRHRSEVLSRWQVDDDLQAMGSIAEAAEQERISYENDMSSYATEMKGICSTEVQMGLRKILQIGGGLASVWLVWALLLAAGDFMVCPLVCALRAQGLELPFPDKKND